MGYFSNLAAQYVPYDHDHSYTPPEKQLLWRLEDLEERLHELTTQQTGKRDAGVCFSESDLRYVLPGQFLSVSDVRKAIELAVNDLAERYGIYVRGKPVEEVPEMDEITEMQISFLDVLSVSSRTGVYKNARITIIRSMSPLHPEPNPKIVCKACDHC